MPDCRFLPSHKDDSLAIGRLLAEIKVAGYTAEVLSILPELLSWAQDLNWPIARSVGEIVAGAGQRAIPAIRAGLESTDEEGRVGLLSTVIACLARDAKASLRGSLEDIARTSRDEVLRQLAQEQLLSSLAADEIDSGAAPPSVGEPKR